MSLADVKDLATLIAAVVAVATLVKGVMEYARDAAQRRLQILLDLRARFSDSPALQEVRCALESDDPGAIRMVTKTHRVDFAAFFEEVALMMNSKLLSRTLAHSLFGFYAVMANDNPGFWDGFNVIGNEAYWRPFTKFAEEMKSFAEHNSVYTQQSHRI
jgi:hypothetical protein